MTDSQHNTVRDFFGRHAPAYAAVYRRHTADSALLLQHLPVCDSWRAVDVAAGTGRIALALAPLVRTVLAIDLTPAMGAELLRVMQVAGVSNVEFVVGDAANLPCAAGSVDLVTCARAAHHFIDVPRVLSEMARVLRRGGHLGLIDMTTPEDAAASTLLNALEQARGRSHRRAFSPDDWRMMMREAGFTIEHCAIQEEIMPFAQWLAPVSAEGGEAAHARRLLAEAEPEVRAQIIAGPANEETPSLLKRRIVMVAHK